jgi:hypothetical protein
LEVDVEIFVGDRVALDFLEERQCLLGLVGAGQFDEDGATGDGFTEADELRTINREHLGSGVLAVKNRGNAIGFAEAAGGAATSLGARGDV